MSLLCSLLLRNGPAKRIAKVGLRWTQSSTNVPDPSQTFHEIYNLPIVQGCAAINNFKKINLFAFGASIPLSYAGYTGGLFEKELIDALITFGLTSTSLSFVIGQAVYRLIGFIYVSQDLKQVKVAYIDFWGKRKEKIYCINDIGPISDLPRPFNIYYKRVETSGDPYYINLKHGVVTNYDAFKHVFDYEPVL